jgi:hypothetical protein
VVLFWPNKPPDGIWLAVFPPNRPPGLGVFLFAELLKSPPPAGAAPPKILGPPGTAELAVPSSNPPLADGVDAPGVPVDAPKRPAPVELGVPDPVLPNAPPGF